MARKIRIDQNLENADWTKQSWDLLGINSKEELIEYLNQTGMSLIEFKKLPIYQLNKHKIDWLGKGGVM